MECRLVQSLPLPTNTIFIGEIVGAYADESMIEDGKPNFDAIRPLLLTMPDNRYWTLGKQAGISWSAGRSLMQSK